VSNEKFELFMEFPGIIEFDIFN